MELCPICNKMTAQKDIYSGDLVCYNTPCYEGVSEQRPSEIFMDNWYKGLCSAIKRNKHAAPARAARKGE